MLIQASLRLFFVANTKVMKAIIHLLKATIIITLCSLAIQSRAANYYWVGGTGNWSDYNTHWATQSGGQIFWNHVPTPGDTVIFDSLSFTAANDIVFADNSIYCHTIKWLRSDSTPIFTHSGNQPVLRIYGSLLIDTTTQWNYQGRLIFCAIDTGNTITTNGASLHVVSFYGDTSASWELQDTLRANHILFSSGNFYSHGHTIITSIYQQVTGNLSRQFLDTSDVYCFRLRHQLSPLVFDADSASIIITGDSMQGGDHTYHKVELMGHAHMTGNNTIDTFVMHSNADIIGNNLIGTFRATRPGVNVQITGTITIADTMIFNGACSGMSAISGSNGSIDFVTPGAILQTIFIDGVTAMGNPAVINSVVQNASGWNVTNVPTPRTLYWVGGVGQWSDTLHWSATSGGTGNECSPTPLDNVNFDANSFTQVNEWCDADNHVTLFADMVWNGVAGTPYLNADTGFVMGFGDLKVQSPVMWYVDLIILRSTAPNTIIDVQSNILQDVKIAGSGSFQQQSPMHASLFAIDGGNYATNGNSIDAYIVAFTSIAADRDFSGSRVNTSQWFAGFGNGIFTAPDSLSTIQLYDLNPNAYNVVTAPGNLQLTSNSIFPDFTVGASAEISGSSTFDTLRFIGNDIQIVLHSGSMQTITGDLQINSSCSAPVTIKSKTPGSHASISKASGIINCDYLILEDIHAMGGATFNANNTCALLNVSGWNVTPPPSIPMYWIGGTGDWNDPLHWSYTSGGAAAGCIPHPFTDVYFDVNSFTLAGEWVNINILNGYCRNMDWTTSAGSPSFASGSYRNRMNCFGSMILEQGVSTYGVNLYMRAPTAGNIIDTKNAVVGNLIFNGAGGTWLLNDTLGCDTLELRTGAFLTNGYFLQANVITSLEIHNRELHLDSSEVITGSWMMNNDSALIFDATAATITAHGEGFQGGNRYYGEVVLDNQIVLTDSDTFGILRIAGSVSIGGTTYVDSLFLDAGGEMIRIGNDTIYIDSALIAISSSSSYIGIQAASPVDHAYIHKTADTVCMEYMILQGIDVSGGATFFAGVYSSDVDNNSGWLWQTCNPGSVNVWPGDANYDLVADNFDILSIGIAFGEVGNTRPNASLTWVAQPNSIWSREFADSTDIVHADCDGDGVVGYSDTTAVSLNYGQIHPARYAAPEEVQTIGAEIKVVITQAAFQPGDTVEIPIWLGTQNSAVANGYGVAFTLNWDHPFVEPGSLEFDYTNTWFAPGSPLHLEKPFYGSQYCDFGVSRTNHADTSGNGELVLMRFVLTQNANGPLKFWFTDHKLIDHNEDTLPMFSAGGTINAAVGMEEFNQHEISAYPNPTNGSLVVNTSLSGTGSVAVYDLAGRVVLRQVMTDASTSALDVAALEAGYYFLIVETNEGIAQVRIQKL